MTAQRIGPSFACECSGKTWFNSLCLVTGKEWQQRGLDQILPANVLAKFGPILFAVMFLATKDNEQDDTHDENMIKPIKLMINMIKIMIKVLEMIIKMIKKKHDKDDNNDGMGWVVCGGVGGVVGRGQIQFLVGWRWGRVEVEGRAMVADG